MRVTKWKLLLIGSYVATSAMSLVSFWTGSIRVETVQQNGLPQFAYPYSDLSFWSSFIALGLLMFSVFLSPIRIREGEKPLRPLLGCGFLSGGIVAVIFSIHEELLMMVMLLVIGVVAVGSGGWLLRSWVTHNQSL